MKDLQDLFESLETEEFDNLIELQDKKSLNPTSVKKIMNYISMVYCAEKGLQEAEVSQEEMKELIDSFNISIALYANIKKGHMEITKGRMMLTDGNSCSFSLTPEGIKHAESLINNQQ